MLNSDWFYRRLVPRFGRPVLALVLAIWSTTLTVLRGYRDAIWNLVERIMHAPVTGPTVPGRAVMVQTVLLAVTLAIGYLVAG